MPTTNSFIPWVTAPLILISGALAQTYNIKDLGTFPGGTVSQGQAINHLGQVAGYARFANYNAHGFVWSELTGLEDLASIPPESHFSSAQAINAQGDVAGYSTYDELLDEHAILWIRGKLRDLGTLPGGRISEAMGIGDLDEVVGFSDSATNSPHAFLWTLAKGMQDLGTLPGGYYSQALAINQSGEIPGYSNAADGRWHAAVWTKFGGVKGLKFLPGGTSASANGINNLGQIVGGSSYAGCGFCTLATVWNNETVRDIGVLPGQGWSTAFAINDKGQAIGWSGNIAFIWSAQRGMQNLNDLIPSNSGWQLSLPTAINDRGQITGQGNINGQSHAFLLTPVNP
jgi:probable HAF family extracellular repeat protein